MRPFAELHLHLEGSIQPETLCEIDPTLSAENAGLFYQFENFDGFLQSYIRVLKLLQTPDHYALAARSLKKQLEQQDVDYAEINLSVGAMIFFRRNVPAIIEAIRKEFGKWPLIFDAIRQHDPKIAVEVAELSQHYGVAFGIGGDENAQPLSAFREAISRVPERFIPHAGEISSSWNVWDAIEHGARRIGHGIRAIDDPDLCRKLRDKQIPLEICLSSNLATGAVSTLTEHPVRKLFDAGVPIVLNTDDPAIFRTTLQQEYELAQKTFGFSEEEMEQIRQNAYQFAME